MRSVANKVAKNGHIYRHSGSTRRLSKLLKTASHKDINLMITFRLYAGGGLVNFLDKIQQTGVCRMFKNLQGKIKGQPDKLFILGIFCS